MSKLNIDCDRASSVVDSLAEHNRDMIRCKNSLRNIRNSVNCSSSSMRLICNKIMNIENDILTEAAKMKTLSEALDKIIGHYRMVEKKNEFSDSVSLGDYEAIINNISDGVSDAVETIGEKAEDAWEMLRNLLVTWGWIDAQRQERVDGVEVTEYQENEMDIYMENLIFSIKNENRFTESTWERADLEERKAILNEFLQRVAGVMGITIGSIDYINEKGREVDGALYWKNGAYNYDLHVVKINEWVLDNDKNIDSYNLMSTIIHEMRHAYQYLSVNNPDQFVVTDETIEAWQISFRDYKSSGDFEEEGMSAEDAYQAYRDQTIEADARDFARQD